MLTTILTILLIAYIIIAIASGMMTVFYIVEHPKLNTHKQITLFAGAVFWPIWIIAGFCWAHEMAEWLE